MSSSSLDGLEASVEHLRKRASSSLVGPRFFNWARTFTCRPASIFYPETEEQVRNVVRLAKSQKKCLRAFGAGHSPSDLVCVGEGDWLINMDKLNKVIDINKADKRVTVHAGIRIRDLHPILAENGLAMSSLGSISDQSLGGAISTATHGTSTIFGNLSTCVRSLTVVTADDNDCEVLTCTPDNENSDLFDASRCGLGLTGIITRIEFQVESAFRLEEEEFSMKTGDFIDSIKDGGKGSIAESAQHLMGWWHPQAGEISISRMNRTEKPLSPPLPFSFARSLKNWVRDTLLGYHWHQVGLLIGRVFPNFLTWHARFMYFKTFKTGCILDTEDPHPVYSRRAGASASEKDPAFPRCSDTVKRIGNSVSIFNYDCLFPQYTYEGVVPIERAQDCLKQMQKWLEGQCRDPKGMRHHFPIEIRFSAKDDVLMSPTNGMIGCYIGIVQYKPYGLPVTYRALFTEFERIIFAHGGKPHWAKSYSCTPSTIQRMFPGLPRFLEIRKKYDPEDVFVNPYAKRHFLGEGDEEEIRGDRFKTTTQSLEDKLKMQ